MKYITILTKSRCYKNYLRTAEHVGSYMWINNAPVLILIPGSDIANE